MTSVFAIDPGTRESGYCWFDGAVREAGTVGNHVLIERLRGPAWTHVVLERIAPFGMPVGDEVFSTVHWTGRLYQVAVDAQSIVSSLLRLEVKQHLCHDSRAKDANIRQALLDRFGGKAAAIGRKTNPGPLYGVLGDAWSALALAVTWWDRARETRQLEEVTCQSLSESRS